MQVKGHKVSPSIVPTLLANWYVSQLETGILNKTTKPKIYIRYVDDIFRIIENKEQVHQFDEELNKMHKDI